MLANQTSHTILVLKQHLGICRRITYAAATGGLLGGDEDELNANGESSEFFYSFYLQIVQAAELPKQERVTTIVTLADTQVI